MVSRSPLLAGLLCCCLTTACASWSAHGIAAGTAQPPRIAVLPITATVPVHHLDEIATPPEPPPNADAEKALIEAHMAAVTTALTASLMDRLSGRFQIVPEEEIDRPITETPEPADGDGREWLAAVGRAVEAQAVLHVELSGYGHIKRRWLAYLIGSGMAEGVVQGVVAATVTNAWGGGAFLFNAYYAPITLEAELIASRDGHRLWHKITFAAVDRKALKKLPKDERRRKEVQLDLTLTKAERKLVASLRKAAKHRN